MTPTAVMAMSEVQAVIEVIQRYESWVSVKASCPLCTHVVFTGGRPGFDWSHILDRHLAQHQPGRARDIEVAWEPSAWCSVCEDGIGDIHHEDDGLVCRNCGTRWDINGTGGEIDPYRESEAGNE